MASSMMKLVSQAFRNPRCAFTPLYTVVRYSWKKTPFKDTRRRERGTIKHRNLIASSCQSLAARGFLRSYKPYKPVENVREIVVGFCNDILGINYDQDLPLSRENKFDLLNRCFKELNHSVPNSLLHKIVSCRDIVEFYETPVKTTVPYDELKNENLPPNLHIQHDYVRFNPSTDTRFKGISAFPRSSTIVSSIKFKGKYKGYNAKSFS